MHQIFIKFIVVTSMLFASGCNGDKAPSVSAPATSGQTQLPAQAVAPNNCPPAQTSGSPSPNASPTPSASTSLALANGITYEQNIKPLVTTFCISCHSSQGNPLKNPDLTVSKTVQDQAYSVFNVLEKKTKISEHSSVNVNANDLSLFNQWRSNSYEMGTAASTGTSTSAGTSSVSGNSSVVNCGSSVNLPTGTLDDLSDLVNSERKKKCDGLGKMVNRDSAATGDSECFAASIDPSWCNPQGIKDKFNAFSNSGNAAEAKMNELKGQGFEIDQCGMENGSKPLATFYKKDVAGQSLQLSFLRP